MSVKHRYDGDLHMVVEESREANRGHLLFLRWLAERGQLEHPVAGLPHPSPGLDWMVAGKPMDVPLQRCRRE